LGNVHTDNLMPGMLLSSDVHDRNGRLLLGAGTELTDKHIYIFRTWGVVGADIDGVEEDEDSHRFSDAIDPELWVAAEAWVKPLFRHADMDHPGMNQLLQLSILRRVHHGIR
jgi:hypothetical protein